MSKASVPEQPWQHVLPATILGTTTTEFVVKKSRFITHLAHVTDIAEADSFIADIRTRFWDARHNCVALSLGINAQTQRSSDDGEPSGTAGIPMLEVLRHRKLTDVVAVVTRYFGGVLLGAGGLVRAYGTAVSTGLDSATIVLRVPLARFHVETDHGQAGRLEYFLRDWLTNHRGVFEAPSYTHRVTFAVLVSPKIQAEFLAELAAFSSGSAHATFDRIEVVDLPA